jgi:hypothetical protein
MRVDRVRAALRERATRRAARAGRREQPRQVDGVRTALAGLRAPRAALRSPRTRAAANSGNNG